MSWDSLVEVNKTLGNSKAFGALGGPATAWSAYNHATADVPGAYKVLSLATDGLGVAQLFPKCPQTPIIQVGLLSIAGMSLQCGFGQPDKGDKFADGVGAFNQVGKTQEAAAPTEQWQGDASKAYNAQVARQSKRSETMARADSMMQEIIYDQAEQVAKARQLLDIYSVALSVMIVPAMVAAAIPGGQPASVAIQVGAVAGSVPLAMGTMTAMGASAVANAAKVQQAISRYNEVTASA